MNCLCRIPCLPPVRVAVIARYPRPKPQHPVEVPLLKLAVVVGLIVEPPDTLRSTVPVNELTVLFAASGGDRDGAGAYAGPGTDCSNRKMMQRACRDRQQARIDGSQRS